MQISRLFTIVYILLGRRQVTARELAARFEVSVRTIYRDVQALSEAGVPVYATQGAGGGIRISDAYVLNKSALTDEEQGQILLALQSMSATGNVDSDQLLSRMAGLFNKDSLDWIEVDFSRWGNKEHDRQVLSALKDAILHRRVLSFTYHGSDGQRTERTVRPVKLIYKNNAWYLQAYCENRKAFRTFKLARMASVAMRDEVFDRQELPAPPPLEQATPQDQLCGEIVTVSLRFEQDVAWRVLDEFEASLIRWEEEGTLRVEADFPVEPWLYSYLFSFGRYVEVLAPHSLREQMKDMLREMLDRYER